MKRYTDPTKKKRSRGEPWQVIYTDLMTIIMVFFVILWSTNQGKDIGISETITGQRQESWLCTDYTQCLSPL